MHCGSHTHHDIVYEIQEASLAFMIMNVNLQGIDYFPLVPDITTSISASFTTSHICFCIVGSLRRETRRLYWAVWWKAAVSDKLGMIHTLPSLHRTYTVSERLFNDNTGLTLTSGGSVRSLAALTAEAGSPVVFSLYSRTADRLCPRTWGCAAAPDGLKGVRNSSERGPDQSAQQSV